MTGCSAQHRWVAVAEELVVGSTEQGQPMRLIAAALVGPSLDVDPVGCCWQTLHLRFSCLQAPRAEAAQWKTHHRCLLKELLLVELATGLTMFECPAGRFEQRGLVRVQL